MMTPPLAAISFSDPLMLAGLLAAAIPVALHLLNRVRAPVIKFPTLRFLKITAQKTSRRRHVQQYFLLLLRMAVFAMIAMAVAHPLIRGGSASLAYLFIIIGLLGVGLAVAAWALGSAALAKKIAPPSEESGKPPASPPNTQSKKYWAMSAAALLLAILLAAWSIFGLTSSAYFSSDTGEYSGRSTALVVILDNSYSMLARQDAATRAQHANEETRTLIAETLKPAEAAILPTNAGAEPAQQSLTADLTSLIGSLDKLTVIGRAKPMKERVQTAAKMLLQSSQPNKMIVVVSDFARSAFADADVFSALKEIPGAKDIQVVLMPVGKGSIPADVGIASFAIAEGGGHAVVGSEITFEAQIVNNSDAADVKDLALYVDDAVVEALNLHVQLGPAGTGSARTTLSVPYRLTESGAHRFSLRLRDAADAMDWNDRRELVLNVAQQVRVLVIGAETNANHQPRSRSAAFYFKAALAPFDGTTLKDSSGKPVAWSITPTYRGADEIKDFSSLTGYAAVFACDLPKVSPALAAALTTYLKQNGRLVWVLGPSVNAAMYNQVLLAAGKELLPATLDQPLISATGATIDWVDLRSDIFANLFDNQEPFRSVVVTGRWAFAGNTLARGRAIGKLADSSPLIVQQDGPGGMGEIYTVLTTPSAAWSNLGATVLLVPVASRMALGDSGRMRAETSYQANDLVEIHLADGEKAPANIAIDVTTPNKSVINVRPSPGDVPRWDFAQTQSDGLYTWRSVDQKHGGMFVVNPPAEEVEIISADVETLGREMGTTRAAIVAPTPAELLRQLENRSEGSTLAPGILALVLMLAVIEALLANRYRPATQNRKDPQEKAEPVAEDRAAA